MKVTKLAWVEAPRSLNKKRMTRRAATIPESSQTACSARKLYAGRSVVTVVVLFSCAACIQSVSSTGERRASRICRVSGWSARLAKRLSQDVDPLVELGILDQNRGQQPDHRAPGR